ncbi:unnamed protein product, partial [Linum tenue]
YSQVEASQFADIAGRQRPLQGRLGSLGDCAGSHPFFLLPLLRLPLLIIDFKKELENWSSLSRFDLFVFFLRGWKYGFFLLFLLIFLIIV